MKKQWMNGASIAALMLVSGCKQQREASAAATPALGAQQQVPQGNTAVPTVPTTPTTVTAGPAARPVAAPRLPADQVGPTLPPIPVGASGPQALGARSLTAERCTLDGEEMHSNSFGTVIGDVAVATNGGVYIVDNRNRVRRYNAAAAGPCVLTLDTAFGTGGYMQLPGVGTVEAVKLHADQRGHVFVSTVMRGSWRLTGAHMDYACAESRGEVRTSEDGRLGFAVSFDRPQRIEFTDAGCTVTPWVYQEPYAHTQQLSIVRGTVYVAGYNGNITQIETRPYDPSGRPRGVAFGRTGTFASNAACYPHEVFACTGGLCLQDGNCRNYFQLDAQNNSLGRAQQASLYGLRYPWTSGVTYGGARGASYASVSQERGPSVQQGFVYRIANL